MSSPSMRMAQRALNSPSHQAVVTCGVVGNRFGDRTMQQARQDETAPVVSALWRVGVAKLGRAVLKLGSALLGRSGADARIVSMVNPDGLE